MTYYEIDQIKLSINQFILTLQGFAEENKIIINQSDKDFFFSNFKAHYFL